MYHYSQQNAHFHDYFGQDSDPKIYGAGDRDRTGDIQLGKLAFYR